MATLAPSPSESSLAHASAKSTAYSAIDACTEEPFSPAAIWARGDLDEQFYENLGFLASGRHTHDGLTNLI